MTEPIQVLHVPAAAGGSDAIPPPEAADLEVVPAEGTVDALKRLDDRSVDCVVVAADPADMAVDEFRRTVREIEPSLPVVIVDPDGSPATCRALSLDGTAYAEDWSAVPGRVRDAVTRRRTGCARDRHARLGRAFRAIARDALRTTGRERVACTAYEYLNESGCYRFVWIGTYDDGSDELSLRVPFEGSFDPGEVTADVAAGTPGFVERAVREGVVTTTAGPATMRSAAAGRSDSGVGKGSMTTAAVPLRYPGGDHGVAVLVSDAPHAFDEAERALLADLGDLIGDALGATEGDDAERYRQFATALAHEVRSPLGLAETYLEFALEDGDEDDIGEAVAALERAESIVDDLLSIAGRDPVTETWERELSADAQAAWEPLDAPGAELVVESSGPVEADHDLVVRLLANLFENAVEHSSTSNRTSSDDAVEHSSTGDRESTDAEGATVRVGRIEDGFYVADDGPGIPEEERDAVFEWGHATGDGPGIGLSLARSIAEAHGWAIAATESRGGGARIEITGVTSGD